MRIERQVVPFPGEYFGLLLHLDWRTCGLFFLAFLGARLEYDGAAVLAMIDDFSSKTSAALRNMPPSVLISPCVLLCEFNDGA